MPFWGPFVAFFPLNFNDPSGHADQVGETGAYWYQLNANPATPADLYLTVDQQIYLQNRLQPPTVLEWAGTVGMLAAIAAAPSIISAIPAIPGAVSTAGWKVMEWVLQHPKLAELLGWSTSVACADGECLNETRTSYEIGEAGEDLVFKYLNDPTLEREVMVYVNEGGKRANYFARLDGLTSTAIHEVKNGTQLSLSEEFRNQAHTYKLIADSLGVELHYWLLRSYPQHVIEWLNELGAIVHPGIPGQ